ncbi:hypothetical protein [Rhodococcus sp. 24CO]|uniref:hypothetical protein n=1 Tax=Rhodococcus sp. 24CO TaxID=3117460 RepID=UPI003D32A568
MRAPARRQPPQIEAAMGISLMSLLRQFNAACTAAGNVPDIQSSDRSPMPPMR